MSSVPFQDHSGSTPDLPRMGSLGHWLVFGTIFIVVAGNAIVPVWSGLIPTMLLIPLAVLLRNGGALDKLVVDTATLPWLLAVFALALLGLLSLLANGGSELNWVTWLSSYVSPIILCLGVRQYCDGLHFVRRCILVILVASSLPLGFGLLQYYREWGIPSGVELLLSRYYLDRMETYMTATFGSTGNTASYLALVLPLTLAASLTRFNGVLVRWLAAGVALTALANTLIVQSRSLLWILVLGVPGILRYFRVRMFGVVFAVAVAAAIFVLPFLQALDELVAHSTSIFGGSEADNSVSERVEAMNYGLRTLLDFPALGVGPGNTLVVNPYTSAHQFWIQQGSELGLGGVVASMILSATILLRALWIWWHRSGNAAGDVAFTCYGAAALYVVYGVLGNMTLANTFVNSWIGLLAILVSLGESCMTMDRKHPAGWQLAGEHRVNGV